MTASYNEERMHQYAGTPDSICRGDPEEAVKRMEEHLLLQVMMLQ